MGGEVPESTHDSVAAMNLVSYPGTFAAMRCIKSVVMVRVTLPVLVCVHHHTGQAEQPQQIRTLLLTLLLLTPSHLQRLSAFVLDAN